MFVKSYVLLVISFSKIKTQDYVEDYNGEINQENLIDFRRLFPDPKSYLLETNEKPRIKKKRKSKSSLYLDDIAHVLVSKNNLTENKIGKMENDFREMLRMKYVEYIYKRDYYWRTFREVKYPNRSKRTVCYKYVGISDFNETICKNCQGPGYWQIEDRPPCPYEVFSVVDEKFFCGAKYDQFTNKTLCPNKIHFNEISPGNCDNPIRTTWRVWPKYNKRKRPLKNFAFCKTLQNCQFVTLYQIKPKMVTFRIINSESDIVFSKIMKNGGKNYACVDACGRLNLNTMKVTKSNKTILVNLMKPSQKSKRKIIKKKTSKSIENDQKEYQTFQNDQKENHQHLNKAKKDHNNKLQELEKSDTDSDFLEWDEEKDIDVVNKNKKENMFYKLDKYEEEPQAERLSTSSYCKKLAAVSDEDSDTENNINSYSH